MSTTFSAYMCVGFEVYPNDLWVSVADKEARCPSGHPQKGNAKFCDECGGPNTHKIRVYPSKGFQNLLKELGHEKLVTLEQDAFNLHDLGVYVNVQSVVYSGDSSRGVWAIAITLAESADLFDREAQPTVSRHQDDVLKAFQQAEQYREALLGNRAREIKLFLSTEYG